MINFETKKGKFRILRLYARELYETINFFAIEKGGIFVAEVIRGKLFYTFGDDEKKASSTQGSFIVIDENNNWELVKPNEIGGYIANLM